MATKALLKKLWFRLTGAALQGSLPAQPRPFSPCPEDWSLTLDDLFAEMKAGKRKTIGSPEREWARDYELSLLPHGVRFPRQGDVYRPRSEITLIAFFPGNSPVSGMEVAVGLSPEDRLRVPDPLRERELGVHLRPVDYLALRQRFFSPQSDDYYFYVKTAVLNESFWLVEDGRGDASVHDVERLRAPH